MEGGTGGAIGRLLRRSPVPLWAILFALSAALFLIGSARFASSSEALSRLGLYGAIAAVGMIALLAR